MTPLFMHQPEDRQVVIERVTYHRNGISGNGFFAILFRQFNNTPMLGVVFDEEGSVACFNRSLIGEGQIDFGQNSFRGDEFEQALRTAIAEYRIAQQTLPIEAWTGGWSPITDPIAEEAPLAEGNADKVSTFLRDVVNVVKNRKD